MITDNSSFPNSKNTSNHIKISEYLPLKILQATQAERHYQEPSETDL